ncbi:hypothetical protein CLI64_10975 [Nostoc sp. CENA543]|uniref:hypothetical protein n=1 Tax=Nostoc sp. CENA543 TaxID=1869241 RepID=UPI000CA1894E|nr:hypothetical protein [Nostoc sp. CENA543]AUT00876.1 hypothetical protein CLI64_10975 [Nostoc sp. CENA543]
MSLIVSETSYNTITKDILKGYKELKQREKELAREVFKTDNLPSTTCICYFCKEDGEVIHQATIQDPEMCLADAVDVASLINQGATKLVWKRV